MQPSLQASFEYVYENKVWAGGGGSGEGSEPNATVFTQRIVQQVCILAVSSSHNRAVLAVSSKLERWEVGRGKCLLFMRIMKHLARCR